jgi:hypothetical protein
MASAGTAPAPIAAQPQSAIAVARPSFLIRISTGSACFYWIAGLTLLNSVAVILNRPLHFVIGLGITAAIDDQAKHLGIVGVVLVLLINGTVAGIFVLLGSLSGKSMRWALVAGMVLYGLDGLLLLAANDILSVAFHAYTIFAISRGLTVLSPSPA